MQQLNEALKPHDLRAEVTMSETLNRLVLTFYDERTDEMVYQFPPRNVLEVVASILQQAGILVDRQA